jgi:hypothetical protein
VRRNQYGIALSTPLPEPDYMHSDSGVLYATGLGSVGQGQQKPNKNSCSTDYLAIKEGLEKTQRFLENDGKILKFLCVEVQSLYPPYFRKIEREITDRGDEVYALSNGHGFVASANAKRYALSFYLASLEVDVLVQKTNARNQGDDEPTTILKRGRLARNWRESQRGRPARYYNAEDFRLGEVVDVYGRLFLMVACDSFTLDYYRDCGIDQTEVPLIAEKKVEISQPIPRQGDGFLAIGSAADTMATVYGMPPVRKDQKKLARNQGRQLRAKAEMVTTSPVDLTREFLITFYLEDDTVQVFEEVKRNSGFWGGTFLKRGKYMNDSNPIIATDIFLGNVICLNGCKLHITEMDNMSLQFCETNPDEFPLANINKIVGEIVANVKSKHWDIRGFFTAADTNNTSLLSSEKFVDILEENSLTNNLLDQEMLTLIRRFSDSSKNNVFYPDFCDLVSHLYFQYYLRGRGGISLKPGELASFSAFIVNARSRSVQWRKILRNASKTGLSVNALLKVFQKYGITLSESMIGEILKRYVVGAVALPVSVVRQLFVDILPHILNVFQKPAEVVEDDLDQMIAARASMRNTSGVRAAMAKATTMAAKIADLRKKNPFGHTSTMRRSKSSAVNPNVGAMDLDATMIDYAALCNDIYASDWI